MTSRARSLALALPLLAALAAPAAAQEMTGAAGGYMRSEWAVEPAPGGRAHVVGYLYNRNIKDAANVWLRVDRVAPDGTVAGSYRRRVVGDVLADAPEHPSDTSDAAMSDDHEIELFALCCGNERALGTPHRHLPDGVHSE